MAKYILIFMIISNQIFGQKNDLNYILEENRNLFQKTLSHAELGDIQIIYTQINRDKKGKPSFITHHYGLNDKHYFYPASTVKLPAAVFALEKLNQLKIKGLTKNTPLQIGVDYEAQTAVKDDTTAQNKQASIAHYIKKILLVSDNDAHNRLYEFLGQDGINAYLKKHGLVNSRFIHRLQTPMNFEQNKHTNSFQFFDKTKQIYAQPALSAMGTYHSNEKILKGKGYINNEDKLVNEPFDFTLKNKFALSDQHHLLKKLMFPEAFPKNERFNLTKSDYDFLYDYMSRLPEESAYPAYPKADYWPSYCKFLMFGSEKQAVIPKNIRIFNKVGDAYGYLLDNAYVVDFENGIEFLLSAMIYCNSDGIFNDDNYDYDTVGFPFMRDLGKAVYDFELKREKKFKPKLAKYLFDYK